MIAFTICSNNYLAKARVLVESIKKKQDVEVYLFLADKKSPRINYLDLGFDNIILPEELNIPNLKWQLDNYNIIEFNTALKGPAFRYLFSTTKNNIIYYFDPDIKVYQPLELFNDFWSGNSILLTPHILEPIPFDGFFPDESLFLNHGIYNLGFLGLKRSDTTIKFLIWWNERLAKKCIIDLKEGFFTDQIWLNLAPTLFKDVTIVDHPGFNAAYWNLHERFIEYNNGFAIVNHKHDLFFYHFSSFDSELEKLVPAENARYNFSNRSEMINLYTDYLSDIEKFNHIDYQSINYYNGIYPTPKPKKNTSLIKRIVKRLFQ